MDILELVGSVELKDVACLQLMADRRADQVTGLPAAAEEEGDSDLHFEVHPVLWGPLIEIWFRARVETSNATFVAAYAAQYERPDDDEIPDDVRRDFVERVAVMAVLPYVREAIHSLGARLRVTAPLMPILRQGEFRLNTGDALDPTDETDSEAP